MLATVLALVVALGSLGIFLNTLFLSANPRRSDLIWSGVGLFYALVLWVSAGRLTGGLLLGQIASVSLLGWLGWEALQFRRLKIDGRSPQELTTEPATAVLKDTAQQVGEQLSTLTTPAGRTRVQERLSGILGGVKKQSKPIPTPAVTINAPVGTKVREPEAETIEAKEILIDPTATVTESVRTEVDATPAIQPTIQTVLESDSTVGEAETITPTSTQADDVTPGEAEETLVDVQESVEAPESSKRTAKKPAEKGDILPVALFKWIKDLITSLTAPKTPRQMVELHHDNDPPTTEPEPIEKTAKEVAVVDGTKQVVPEADDVWGEDDESFATEAIATPVVSEPETPDAIAAPIATSDTPTAIDTLIDEEPVTPKILEPEVTNAEALSAEAEMEILNNEVPLDPAVMDDVVTPVGFTEEGDVAIAEPTITAEESEAAVSFVSEASDLNDAAVAEPSADTSETTLVGQDLNDLEATPAIASEEFSTNTDTLTTEEEGTSEESADSPGLIRPKPPSPELVEAALEDAAEKHQPANPPEPEP